MEPYVLEWLNLLLRIAHVVAAIMWVGDSFLFMWMDSHLSTPDAKRQGDVAGELWMTHSGGFYEVVKRKSLLPHEMPGTLYWFKWESYSTWITGFFLITVVYYLGGAAMLVDASSPLSHGAAVGLSLGLLVSGLVVYHLLCLTPLIRHPRIFGAVALVAVCSMVWGLLHVFTARATFLQTGAMLGTIMSSNVLLRIIPSQQHMLAATREGRPVDTSYGLAAKQRSTHNHYLTFPVIFTMLSNHLPGVYGHAYAPVVLGLVFVFAVGTKYIMNVRRRTHPLIIGGTVLALASVIFMTVPAPASAGMAAWGGGEKVSFATVQQIIQARCVTCHAEKPTNPSFNAAPVGVKLDDPQLIAALAPRIMVRAVQTRTMPLGNLTGMADQERALLGAWVAQGADVDASGPSALGALAPPPAAAPPATGDVATDPVGKAQAIFAMRCAACHGAGGAGDGAGAAALTPKPRNFTDAAWQQSVTDAAIAKAIGQGGAAVGKSSMMPANPDLADNAELLDALVKHIRSLAH